ncbi:MAG TPA: hypothetical protein VGX92_11075 [Pyrinomonadaceae bacterium]|nr:hypothetical protein [Pyrinomonadaceae bacterium]
MITGFNTYVEHDGVTYHVQTEDKGLESPLILSLVYLGGAILASKRSPYNDLIAAGFSEQTLAERLQRQHKLICAAINAGRIDDLKRMSPRSSSSSSSSSASGGGAQQPASPPEAVSTAPVNNPARTAPPAAPPAVNEAVPAVGVGMPPPPVSTGPPAQPPPQPVVPSLQGTIAEKHAPADLVQEEPTTAASAHALHLGLLEERELHGGEFVTLRVRLSRGPEQSRDAVPDATITLKILGTTFRPVISSARTDRDGIAIVFAALPRFTTGRAAILIRANADGEEAEMRRIIHPS